MKNIERFFENVGTRLLQCKCIYLSPGKLCFTHGSHRYGLIRADLGEA